MTASDALTWLMIAVQFGVAGFAVGYYCARKRKELDNTCARCCNDCDSDRHTLS